MRDEAKNAMTAGFVLTTENAPRLPHNLSAIKSPYKKRQADAAVEYKGTHAAKETGKTAATKKRKRWKDKKHRRSAKAVQMSGTING